MLRPHLLLLHHPGVEYLSRRKSVALHWGCHKIRSRRRGQASFSVHVAIAARDRHLGILRFADPAAHLWHHVWKRDVSHLLGIDLLLRVAWGRIWLSARCLILSGLEGLSLRLDRQTGSLLLNKVRLGNHHLRPCVLRSQWLGPCKLGPERLRTGQLRLQKLC